MNSAPQPHTPPGFTDMPWRAAEAPPIIPDQHDPPAGDANPGHGTHKDPAQSPRGAGDGELQEQPDSIGEARQPGPAHPEKTT